jgi:hypothetical protein
VFDLMHGTAQHNKIECGAAQHSSSCQQGQQSRRVLDMW